MTAASRQFCAIESAEIGDPLVGTAAHATRNLLVSWPRAKWLRNLRQASDMPEEVLNLLSAIADGGRRVNLIHRREQPSHHHRLVLMPEGRTYDVKRKELAELLHAFIHGKPLERWQTGSVNGSLILCCTHGKKDKCCAKFGYRSYKALASAAREHSYPFDVWESSHLGGCRLAASVMVFPALRKYGRLTDDDVPRMLQAEAEDRPYLPCYRGDSTLTPPEQCAQVAALMWLEKRGMCGGVTVKGEARWLDAHRQSVPVRWQTAQREGWLEVTCRAYELIRHDTCADYEQDGAQPSQVWHAMHIIEQAPTDDPA
ncbi:sucrase ferredoxin [Modicisalibacter luteus]|uniref:sucrase ferredoxin n=1 Tax=Modicisalibacter luteus TaxID=453962 RepID=UPI0036364093